MEALDRGELTVDIASRAMKWATKLSRAALDALEGKSVESVIDSGSEVITADNIDAYIADCGKKVFGRSKKERVSFETLFFILRTVYLLKFSAYQRDQVLIESQRDS